MIEPEADQPAPKKPADPLAVRIEAALLGNLTANNANPDALEAEQYAKSRRYQAPKPAG